MPESSTAEIILEAQKTLEQNPNIGIAFQEKIKPANKEKPITVLYQEQFTLDKLEQTFGFKPDEIPAILDGLTTNLVEKVQNNQNAEKCFAELELIYRIRQALLNEPKPAEFLAQSVQDLSTLEGFINYIQDLGLEISNFDHSQLNSILGQFNEKYNSRYRLIHTVSGEVVYTSLSPLEVNWQVFQTDLGHAYLVDQSVVTLAQEYLSDDQVYQMIKSQPEYSPGQARFLVHDTNSNVLSSIKKEGGLLSANEAQKRGLMPVSGEITQFPKGGISLTNVYATSEGITSGNNTSAFFDQETVSFIINEVQQETTMRQELIASNIPTTRHDEIINRKLRRLPSFQPLNSDYLMSLPIEERQKVIKEKLRQARTSDQSLSSKSYESFLGSKVPLKNISIIAVPFDLLGQARNLFGKTTRLLVREAAEMVNNKSLVKLI